MAGTMNEKMNTPTASPPSVVVAASASASSASSSPEYKDKVPSLAGARAAAPAAGNAEARTWNTRNLGSRLAADVASAAAAGALVAPVITMIDKAIIENASGRAPLMTSLRTSATTALLRPHTFFLSRPFALIFLLYTGTYATANTLDTASSTVRNTPAHTITSGAPKFAATSAANLTLCLYKDSQFTQIFGRASVSGATARAVPAASYALFALRDCLTIFASFNLPPLLAPSIPLGAAAERYVSRLSAAQFVTPAALQLLSTPLHLLGLDLYNRAGREVGFRERLSKVRVDWLKSSVARMCRIVPAFGVGGVVNNSTRMRLMGKLE